MKKLFKQLHLWLSLPAGIFVILLCLTGAILVFQRDIQQWMGSGQYRAEGYEGRQPLPLDSLVDIACRVAEADGRKVTSLTVYADPSRTVDVGVAGQKGSYYSFNPYTGELTGAGAPGSKFFSSVRGLHRWLLLSGEGRAVGRMVIGISTLFFLVILVSGILIAIPKRRSQWKQFLSVKRGKSRHVWWYTSHRAFGWYCVVFLLLMGLTGPMWSFGWYRSGVGRLFGIDMPQRGNTGGGHHGKGSRAVAQPDALAWNNALAQIRAQEPGYVSISLTAQSATVKTAAHHYRASDTYRFDAQGRVTGVQRYADLPAARKVMGYAYLLHTGVWGGWFVKLLYFVACLGGVYLTVSGYWLYIRRLSKKS